MSSGEELEDLREWNALFRVPNAVQSQAVNSHQTTPISLSDQRDCASRTDRISRPAPIRYQRTPTGGQSEQDVACEFLLEREPKTPVMTASRTCVFLIGVIYSIVAIGGAAASLGYQFDVQNSGYGFRALVSGTAVLMTVTFLASLGLIYGVIENRRGFVAAWLVLQIVVPMYTAAFYFWAIFASGDKNVFGVVDTAVPVIAIVAAVHILGMIGCTIAVNNFYSYLKIRDALKIKDMIE